MALPKIKHSLFSVELPSTKETIKLRPFTVKEEKLLLLVASGKPAPDASEEAQKKFLIESTDTIKQIINNCVVTPEFEVDEIATFDIEWLFLQMRINSVGTIIELALEKNGKTYEGVLDLNNVKIEYNEKHSNIIKVNEEIGIKMKYPTFNFDKFSDSNSENFVMKMFVSCIDSIFDNDKVYPVSETSEEELNEFVDSLSSATFKDVGRFFDTMPKVSHTITLHNVKNPNDEDDKEEFKLSGISDFF